MDEYITWVDRLINGWMRLLIDGWKNECISWLMNGSNTIVTGPRQGKGACSLKNMLREGNLDNKEIHLHIMETRKRARNQWDGARARERECKRKNQRTEKKREMYSSQKNI